MHNVNQLKQVVYDAKQSSFYIVANKYKGNLGMYMIKLDENNVTDFRFAIQWPHLRDIEDVSMYIDEGGHKCKGNKQLIIAYKTIFVNTFNVLVIEISD